MSKKRLLEVGQIVWLETTSRHGCDVKFEDEPSKMIVLEANKTSAYIWHEGVEKPYKVRYKVEQKNHRVKYCIPDGRSYRLWLSKEEYDQNVAYEKEMKELLNQAHKKIDSMGIDDLRTFVSA